MNCRHAKKKVSFFVTESWYFLTHRLPLAEACEREGWGTSLITRLDSEDHERLAHMHVIPFDIRRASHHPGREIVTLVRTFLVLWKERPSILHAVGLKPVLYGGLSAALLRCDAICALAGLGYLFTSSSRRIALLRYLVLLWMRLVLRRKRCWVVVQNNDDYEKLISRKVVSPERTVVIRGSGVDLSTFHPMREPDGVPVFAVVARMLADKGIREAVEAGRILRAKQVPFRLVLVGKPDEHNPSSLSESTLMQWHHEGLVEWLGHRKDIVEVWRNAHVCLLPSYREGMPKSLLEAAACGRPIITTNVPGCREVVSDGVEGILVPARDAASLAAAMERLALSPELRVRMGAAARSKAEAEFGLERVVAEVMVVYKRLLADTGSG